MIMRLRNATIMRLSESDKSGLIWDVTLIRAGESANKIIYPISTLREALPLFEGARACVYERRDGPNHLTDAEKQVPGGGFPKAVIGWYSDVRLDESTGEVRAKLHLFESARWLADMLTESMDAGQALFELSIDGDGEFRRGVDGELLLESGMPSVERILEIDGVDVVTEGAAGGKFNRLVASMNAPVPDQIRRLAEQEFEIQTLVFAKDADWTADTARAWAEENGFSVDKIDETETSFRIRQRDPNQFEQIRAIEFGDPSEGITAMGGSLKSEFREARGRMNEAKKLLESISKNFEPWTEGFAIGDVTDETAKQVLLDVLDQNAGRASAALGRLEESSDQFAPIGRGISTIRKIQSAVSGDRLEEAASLLSVWSESKGDNAYSFHVKEQMDADADGGDGDKDKGKKKKKEEERVTEADEPDTKKPETNEPDEAEKKRKKEELEEAKMTEESMKRLEALEQKMEEDRRSTKITEALRESKLAEGGKTRVKRLLESHAELTDEVIADEIKKEQDYVASLSDSGKLKGHGRSPLREGGETDVEVVKERREKLREGLNNMFEPVPNPGVPAFGSLHEALRVWTGYAGSKAQMGEKLMESIAFSLPSRFANSPWDEPEKEHAVKLREARLSETLVDSDFSEALGDSIRRILQKPSKQPEFQSWRRVVSRIVAADDFRAHRFVRVGGFNDLDTVGEGETYQTLAKPTDVEETAALSKKGNLFDVSMESLINDDIGAITEFPRKFGFAAMRTLVKDVLVTNLQANPNTQDATALIAAGHNNNQTAALDAATLETAVLQIKKQTEQDSGERLGLRPKILVVPPDLEGVAAEILGSPFKVTDGAIATIENSSAPNRFPGVYGLDREPLVNQFQTDTNDWFVIADPRDADTMAVMFFQGRQEPEIIVQDQPQIGSNFTADKITWKVRFIWAVTLLDHRPFAGSIVA